MSLRIPESRLELLGGIRSGDWERVLGMLRPLRLPPSRLVDLYELVFRDLLVLGEQSGAASLLSAAEPFIFLQETDTPRFFELQELTMIPSKDLTEARLYPGPTKDERRAAAAADLENHLDSVEPGRLLKLIGQALKYQAEKGLIPVETAYDLFKGGPLVLKAEDDETPLSEPFQTLPPFSRTQHPEAVVFSPDGQFLVTGTVDGFIEVWNYMTGKLRKDLEWQARVCMPCVFSTKIITNWFL